MRSHVALLGGALLFGFPVSIGCFAGVYAGAGVRSNPITVCFVGDAVTSRPLRVQQILTYIREYQFAANIRFNFLGTCSPPTTQQNGNDFYDGDIRIVIPATSVDGTTSQVPGKGRSEEHTSELQSRGHLVCRLLLEK